MFGLRADEPAICHVTGHDIIRLINRHLGELARVLPTYERALAEKRAGHDWQDDIDQAEARRRTALIVRDAVVGTSRFTMTIPQWIDINNRFPDMLDADAVVRKVDQEHARVAVRAPAPDGPIA
jgi:hypothetical protein